MVVKQKQACHAGQQRYSTETCMMRIFQYSAPSNNIQSSNMYTSINDCFFLYTETQKHLFFYLETQKTEINEDTILNVLVV
jgi:hypothetical protein